MTSIHLTQSNGAPVLVESIAPLPQPGRGELLIRVHAAGVTPSELLWYPTSHSRSGEDRAEAVPCQFSGVVAAVGEEVGSLELGREVFGMNDWFSDGAMAEYCVAAFDAVAPKPPRVSHVDAASVPIGALTAWQGLFSRAKLRPNERVLVHGGAGAVGIFAVQLAHLHGAEVTATASARNAGFVAGLGADQVIDYHSEQFEECVKAVDVVFDTVGGDTLERSWRILKGDGRMVTIAATGDQPTDARAKQAFFIVEPNQKQLVKIGDLIGNGRLRAIVDAVIPLSQAADAYAGTVPRQGRGKLVVDMMNT